MKPDHSVVKFGHSVVVIGLMAGVAICLGVLAIVLAWGRDLPPNMRMVLCIVAIAIGGLIGLTAAFFGAVMPAAIHGIDKGKHGCRCDMEDEEKEKTE